MAAAAYRAAVELTDVRTGQVHDYSRRSGVISSEIVMPDGSTADREALWNVAESAEKRKDSRTAREWVLALPGELSGPQRRQLALDFAKTLGDRYGVAVDVALHEPDRLGDKRNWHAHLLVTTREVMQVDGTIQFGKKTAIELADKDRKKAGMSGTSAGDIEQLRAAWAELTNKALGRAGIVDRVDHRSFADREISLTPTKHIGVHALGMSRRGIGAERVSLTDQIRRENAAQIVAKPDLILESLSRTQAVFTRRDVAREIHRFIDDADQFQSVLTRLDNSPELVEIRPGVGREAKYSTREMIATEARMVATAERLSEARGEGVSSKKVESAITDKMSLSDEQKVAIRHITGPSRFACVIGDAGTGKSFAMATAREAFESAGFRVRGAALAGKAADGLQEGSGIESQTLASLERGWAKGYGVLGKKDVLIIDEAGMIGARQLDRVLAVADKAGAKVVLLGDDKQLAAIEAGAPFRALVERNGAAEITEIRRQKDDWARRASHEFARGSARAGLDAYRERGAVHLYESRELAKTALADAWMKGRTEGSSIILAHANTDVQALNIAVRNARRAAGELGDDYHFGSDQGSRAIAKGDRIVFLRNDRSLGVKNGSLGTVVAGEDGKVTVQLDAGQTVHVDHKAYAALDHGYAVTVHKAQGVTVDRAYVLASGGMDRSLSYVAMTRHRDRAELFAGSDDFRDYDSLARRLGRERPKESTLDYTERRGDDRLSTLENARAWIERGKERLGMIADRATAAVRRAFERTGRPAPDISSMADSARNQIPNLPGGSDLPKRKTTAELIAQNATEKTSQIPLTLDEVHAAAKARILAAARRAGGPINANKIIEQADSEALAWVKSKQDSPVQDKDEQSAKRDQARHQAREQFNRSRGPDKGRGR